MAQFIVTVSDAQLKALEWGIVDVQEWVNNALHNKARRCIDTIVEEHSEYQPKKLTVAQKEQIVLDTPLQTAAQKQAALEAKTS